MTGGGAFVRAAGRGILRATRPTVPAAGRAIPAARTGLVLALLLVFSGCAGLEYLLSPPERPTAEILSVDLTGLSFDYAEATAVVEVRNSNDVALDMDSLTYSMSIGDFVPVSGNAVTGDSGLRIPAEGSVDVEVPMRVTYEDLFSSVSGIADRSETEYTATVVPAVSVPLLGVVELPLEHTGTIPVLRLPELSFDGIELRSVGLSSAKLGIGMRIDNPNDAALIPRSLPYEFAIDGRTILSGDLDVDAVVEGNAETRQVLTVEIPFFDVGRSFRDAIFGEAPLAYSLDGSFTFGLDLPLVPDTTIPFSFDGNQPL